LDFLLVKPVSLASSSISSVLKLLLNFSAKNIEFLGNFPWLLVLYMEKICIFNNEKAEPGKDSAFFNIKKTKHQQI